jgi:hypothetical protein
MTGGISCIDFLRAHDDWTTGRFDSVEAIPARCDYLREVARGLELPETEEVKVTIEMTPEQLAEIRLLANAPHLAGPADTTAYVIPRARMEILREVLSKVEDEQ